MFPRGATTLADQAQLCPMVGLQELAGTGHVWYGTGPAAPHTGLAEAPTASTWAPTGNAEGMNFMTHLQYWEKLGKG